MTWDRIFRIAALVAVLVLSLPVIGGGAVEAHGAAPAASTEGAEVAATLQATALEKADEEPSGPDGATMPPEMRLSPLPRERAAVPALVGPLDVLRQPLPPPPRSPARA